MSPGRITEMFDKERQWLARQPGMWPWQAGCSALSRQLREWLREYSEPLCEQAVTTEHQAYPSYECRLWRCWSHHWRAAAEAAFEGRIDGREVAQRVRSGRGYSRGGRLGGNPLRDVVLAEAVVKRDNRATVRFQSDYYGFSKGLAGKIDRRFQLDAEEWWGEFLDHLAGYSRRPGKLERFFGKCALRNWLGTVLWRFLRRRPLPSGAGADQLDRFPADPADEDRDPARGECLQLFSEIVGRALDELPKQDRLALCLLYLDGLKLKEVAQILGVHPGNAGRQRDRATQALCELTAKHAAKVQRQEAYQQCLGYLTGGAGDFAEALREALEQHHQREDAE
jgi:RNA polymerase sigma factor (sigma-70 family)